MKIIILNRQRDLRLSLPAVRALIQALLDFQKVVCSEIFIHFVTEKKICNLHSQFFHDPSPTDCISFPIDSETLGEIFVCPKAALRYGQEHDIDPYQELSLYLVHGFLHLLGYDDLEPSDRRAMRKKEKSCMDYLKTNQKILLQ